MTLPDDILVPDADEQEAWDRFASAALPYIVPQSIPSNASDVDFRAKKAAQFADAMLIQRRLRVEYRMRLERER